MYRMLLVDNKSQYNQIFQFFNYLYLLNKKKVLIGVHYGDPNWTETERCYTSRLDLTRRRHQCSGSVELPLVQKPILLNLFGYTFLNMKVLH